VQIENKDIPSIISAGPELIQQKRKISSYTNNLDRISPSVSDQGQRKNSRPTTNPVTSLQYSEEELGSEDLKAL